MSDIDVTEFGFRLPTPVAPSSSGDAAFDKAIETLRKRAKSQAKKPDWGLPKLPARLTKPKEGDLERVLALLPQDVFDSGVYTYDLTWTENRDQYLAAWRKTVEVREPHEGLVAALVGLALTFEGGEEALMPLLPTAMKHPYLVVKLVNTYAALPELPSPELLALTLEALAIDGTPRDMYLCWYSAARVAVRLGPETAIEHLLPHLSTDRAKAVRDALAKQETLDASWRDPLLPLVTRGVEIAVQLAARLPPDPELLDVLAERLQSDLDRSGFVLPTHPALPFVIAHADDAALDRFPPKVAELIRGARG